MALRDWLKREPFSCVDAVWLKMEQPTNLMMINGVFTLAEPVSVQDLKALITERLVNRYERFSQVAERPLTALGYPHWRRDPTFDISAHIRRIGLPGQADELALQEMISDLMSAPLDYSKPLWQVHLVENYRGGSAVICRLHHCIGDGVALVRVLLSLTDEQQNANWSERPSREVELEQSWGTLGVIEPAVRAVQEGIQLAERVMEESYKTLADPRRALALAQLGLSSAELLGRLAAMPADPPTSLRGAIGVRKCAAWSQPIPLADIKRIRYGSGGTVNDIILCVVTGALRRYLVSRGDQVDGLTLRAVVPVNLRPLEKEIKLGNHFGLVHLPLPIGIKAPGERLAELRRQMSMIKSTPEPALTWAGLGVLGLLPVPILRQMMQLLSSKSSGVMTNVPGPRKPLFIAGRKVDSIMYWVPQSGSLGLGVSILSYAGDVRIGIMTDAKIEPNPSQIIQAFAAELDELRCAAPVVDMEADR